MSIFCYFCVQIFCVPLYPKDYVCKDTEYSVINNPSHGIFRVKNCYSFRCCNISY